MARRWFIVASAIGLTPVLYAETKAAREPRVSTIYPVTGQTGQTYPAVIRGTGLDGASAIHFLGKGVSARVLRVESEAATATDAKSPAPTSLHVEIAVDSSAKPGSHAFRVLTSEGISNDISLRIAAEPVVFDTDVATPFEKFPSVVAGRITSRGEIDTYWIKAEAGQTLTFEAFTPHPAFDPSLSLYEQSGSWFDPERLNRIAFNDEPLFFPGLSTNARLVHRFSRAGKYCVKLQAFSGQGGPDYVYELRISPGVTPEPALHPKQMVNWEERQFTRPLTSDWLDRLSRRGGNSPERGSLETYRAIVEGSGEVPVMVASGIVEGRLTAPAEAHVIKLKLKKPENLVIEVETPEATMPRFNPVVRLMEPGGAEIATNVYTKRNNNGLYMMKMIQVKTAVPLRASGEYIMQIRDITTDCAGEDFVYRVLVRPEIPHIGKISVSEETLNLKPGSTKPLNLLLEREEGFNGHVALTVTGLPPGVTAIPGVPDPLDKPPLPNAGKLERYIPKPQKASVLLVTEPDATPTASPVTVQVVARPAVDGRLGEPITVKEIPLVVVPRRPS